MYFVVAVLLIIVILFGVTSGMQSYATAQQAQATQEVAKVAQINAWGNLVTILTVVLTFVVFVALIAVAAWLALRWLKVKGQRSNNGYIQSTPRVTQREAPQFGMNDLIQLEMLKVLRSMNPTSPPTPLLQERGEQEPVDDFMSWLR